MSSNGRSGMRKSAQCALILWLIASGPAVTPAVILYSTADPEANTTAPTGELEGAGWALEGNWGNFLGTPIAAFYFLTARHVGGAVGDQFQWNGHAYETTAAFDDLESDLRLWQVNSAFTNYAQVYTRDDEAGQGLVVFGRGTQRGEVISLTTAQGAAFKGWAWGPWDGRKRWGQNQVASVVNGDQARAAGSVASSQAGDLLKVFFDADAGPNEAHLSAGDSGGGIFIRDGSIWKLAGINYAVNGPYNFTNSGVGFEAALVDERGLYVEEDGAWSITPNRPDPQPGAFYGTRISSHLPWIQMVLSGAAPIVQSAGTLGGPFANEVGAGVDAAGRTLVIEAPATMRFYRLSGRQEYSITSLKVSDNKLILTFE